MSTFPTPRALAPNPPAPQLPAFRALDMNRPTAGPRWHHCLPDIDVPGAIALRSSRLASEIEADATISGSRALMPTSVATRSPSRRRRSIAQGAIVTTAAATLAHERDVGRVATIARRRCLRNRPRAVNHNDSLHNVRVFACRSTLVRPTSAATDVAGAVIKSTASLRGRRRNKETA